MKQVKFEVLPKVTITWPSSGPYCHVINSLPWWWKQQFHLKRLYICP